MKLKKLTTAAVACIFVFGAVFGTLSMDNEKNVQAISSALYDSEELAGYAERIAGLVNSERESYGLDPVALSPVLSEAANTRAKEIITSFSHTRPNGTSCFTAISELGVKYSAAAENIAYGQKSPESVMKAWMNSQGHRANILNSDMEYIGVGAVYENGIYYWTQFFAASEQLAPETPKPAETTVTETEDPKPAETTVTETETPKPAETTVPETETPKPAETTITETEAPKPAETTVPKTETPKPAETTARPCETQCSVDSNGEISCTPCETQCSVNSDGQISCTPCTPCETQCSVNSDGEISCTPCTPCETQCSVNSDGQISCTPCETQCPANSSNSGNYNSSCPLQNSNILEWLIPQILNQNNNNSNCYGNSSDCNSGNCYGNSSDCSSGNCYGNSSDCSSGNCYGNSSDCSSGNCYSSGNNYGGNSSSGNNGNYYFGVEKYIGGDSPTCWGN